jgi:ATP/maltotriose-dependent transcriptional regulator MalT
LPVKILSTKLAIPPVRSRLVVRSRLIEKLNQGMECGFVLVSAPAGYGKTTLLSAWLDQVECAITWLSLDDGDNDLARFLAYLAAALQQVNPSIGEALENPPDTLSKPEAEPLLTPLINQLAQIENPFCLVLDDYHAIHNQEVHQIVSFMLEHRPPALHLVIATRADPPLPLSRFRVRSQMMELRLADLRFSSQEAADFLDHTMGLDISPEDVARITRRTEGWIAGLQMTALSIQNTEDLSSFITAFTSSDHYIFDYLLEEILERQSPEIRRFLLYTSILDQLTGPLCDALLEGEVEPHPTRPSSVILEQIEHANLFIVALDYEHRWYRYHQLFSDLLKPVLDQAYPGLSVELHRRACRWYEGQDMFPEALQHAISSGNMQLVAQIVSANVLVLVENDEVMPTLRKIDSLPNNDLITMPWLGIARAWVVGTGQTQQSLQILDEAEKQVETMADGIEPQRLKGYIAAARAFVYNALGDLSQLISNSHLANELLPSDDISVRAMNLALWGKTLSVYEHDPDAIPILEQALGLALKAQKPHVAMIAASQLATSHLFAGRLHEVQQVCLEALEISEEYERRYLHTLPAAANIYPLLARVLAEWGENEQAIQMGRKGLMLSERWGRVNTEVLCLIYLGRALMFANEPEQARQIFQRAESAAQKISTDSWHDISRFILDSLLDSETPDSSEITRLRQRLQGSRWFFPWLKARLLLREDQPDQALVALEKALVDLKGQPSYDIVRIYALRALAFQAKGDEKQALVSLRQALELGEPENRVATFVREGAAMERLLQQAQSKSIAPEFVQRLLAAFESRHKQKPEPARVSKALIEPLSEREMDILKLLAQGCPDKKIAETLVIARDTVHKHLSNIYGKLGVHSRIGAIVRARELGLL